MSPCWQKGNIGVYCWRLRKAMPVATAFNSAACGRVPSKCPCIFAQHMILLMLPLYCWCPAPCYAPAGGLLLTTECGLLEVSPGQVAVVPRGIRFSVALLDGTARGYVLEIFQGHFCLPDLGPIGEQTLAESSSCAHSKTCEIFRTRSQRAAALVGDPALPAAWQAMKDIAASFGPRRTCKPRRLLTCSFGCSILCCICPRLVMTAAVVLLLYHAMLCRDGVITHRCQRSRQPARLPVPCGMV
jgi:hypothetical protein